MDKITGNTDIKEKPLEGRRKKRRPLKTSNIRTNYISII